MKEKFTSGQRKTLLLCFLCYSAAYTGRLNLSAALPGLRDGMALTAAQAGMFQTVFALIYAVGQIVNGARADRAGIRRSIGTGLILSAACNVLLAVSDNYALMLVLWALNGAAQSMLWTPIVKLTSMWFHGAQRERASFVLAVTVIFGHFAAWALSGALASVLSWRWSFAIPPVLMVVMGVAAILAVRDRPETVLADDTEGAAAADMPAMPIKKLICGTGLAALLVCCICTGFVRDGVVTWAPTILAADFGDGSLNSAMLSLIIPVLNLGGVILVRRCYYLLKGSARGAVSILLAVGALLSAALMGLWKNAALCALLMGLCCAVNYGINPLLTTIIPMDYDKSGRVGLVAGLIDCFIYVGSALTGVAAGAVIDAVGWQGVYAMWIVVSAVGAAFGIAAIRGEKRMKNQINV